MICTRIAIAVYALLQLYWYIICLLHLDLLVLCLYGGSALRTFPQLRRTTAVVPTSAVLGCCSVPYCAALLLSLKRCSAVGEANSRGSDFVVIVVVHPYIYVWNIIQQYRPCWEGEYARIFFSGFQSTAVTTVRVLGSFLSYGMGCNSCII